MLFYNVFLFQVRYSVDHRRVCVTAGKGGDGISCFHSEPRKMFGGPDGGDGGDGGHIILKGKREIFFYFILFLYFYTVTYFPDRNSGLMYVLFLKYFSSFCVK